MSKYKKNTDALDITILTMSLLLTFNLAILKTIMEVVFPDIPTQFFYFSDYGNFLVLLSAYIILVSLYRMNKRYMRIFSRYKDETENQASKGRKMIFYYSIGTLVVMILTAVLFRIYITPWKYGIN